MGLNFIKRLKTIDDNLKKAEICRFFSDYDTAEKIYNNADRKDLSIMMRLKLGQWDIVINIMNEKGVVDEDYLKKAYSHLTDQYMDNKDLKKQKNIKANNIEGLINVWFITEE